MTDNAENSELLIECQETNAEIQEKEETIPINQKAAPMGAEQKAKEEVVQEAAPGALKPAPKSRGRPAGSKDNKPRIKRVPAQQPQPQQQQETAAKEKRRKKVEIRYEEPEEPQPEEPEEPEEQLPPPKSPRTLHKERVQAAAMQRRQMAQARQDHFERILDNFMGF